MKILAFILFAATAAGAQTITFGSGVTFGSGLTIPATPAVVTPPTCTDLCFTVPAGSYSSPQTVTMSYLPSPTSPIFYTLDGTQPSIAAQQFTGTAIPIAAPTTVNALVEQVGMSRQAINAITSSWKPKTLNGGPCTSPGPGNCPTSFTAGGVGANQPFSWYMTFGSAANSPMIETMTGQAGLSGETQMLFIYNLTGSAANNATQIAEHKWVEPTVGNSIIANNELDIEQVDTVHTIGGSPVNHNVGLQCNQQSGKIGWQVNGTGPWNSTGITAGCNIANGGLSTSSYTSIDYSAHWIIGDTGCGGHGCIYLDRLVIITGCDLTTGTCSGTPSVNYLGGGPHGCTAGLTNNCQWVSGYPVGTVAARPESWSAGCGLQDQIDLVPHTSGTAGTAGYTGGRKVAFENVHCGNSTLKTGTAVYSGPL